MASHLSPSSYSNIVEQDELENITASRYEKFLCHLTFFIVSYENLFQLSLFTSNIPKHNYFLGFYKCHMCWRQSQPVTYLLSHPFRGGPFVPPFPAMVTSLPEQARVLSHRLVWSKTPLQSCYQFLHFPTWIILLCLVDKMSDLSHDVFETQYIIFLYVLLILPDLLSVRALWTGFDHHS